jgi:hypothetical protein
MKIASRQGLRVDQEKEDDKDNESQQEQDSINPQDNVLYQVHV